MAGGILDATIGDTKTSRQLRPQSSSSNFVLADINGYSSSGQSHHDYHSSCQEVPWKGGCLGRLGSILIGQSGIGSHGYHGAVAEYRVIGFSLTPDHTLRNV
jgi:hypothetical protein